LISNFCRVLNVVCFLLGNPPASEFYMPAFQNTLFHLHTYPPMKMEQTECSETPVYKIQMLEDYPEESIQQQRFRSSNIIVSICQILSLCQTIKEATWVVYQQTSFQRLTQLLCICIRVQTWYLLVLKPY